MSCSGSRSKFTLTRNCFLCLWPQNIAGPSMASLLPPVRSEGRDGRVQVNHLSLFQLTFLEHSWYSAQWVTKLKGEKRVFLTALLTALFYWLDRIKYKNRGVQIPIHFLCSEQTHLSAGQSHPPYPPMTNFPEMVTLNRNYILKASEVLSLYTAL